MLRVTTARRLLATLLAPWLVVFLTMPEAVHTCAMHSAGAMAHVHGAAAGGHQMDGMSGMEMAGMSHDGASASAVTSGAPTTPSRDVHCTCPEGCCTVAATVAVAPSSLSWVRELLGHQEPQYPGDVASAGLSTDVRLPFANGPPAQA